MDSGFKWEVDYGYMSRTYSIDKLKVYENSISIGNVRFEIPDEDVKELNNFFYKLETEQNEKIKSESLKKNEDFAKNYMETTQEYSEPKKEFINSEIESIFVEGFEWILSKDGQITEHYDGDQNWYKQNGKRFNSKYVKCVEYKQ